MFNEQAISMPELEQETAELLPGRETLQVINLHPQWHHHGYGDGDGGGYGGGWGWGYHHHHHHHHWWWGDDDDHGDWDDGGW